MMRGKTHRLLVAGFTLVVALALTGETTAAQERRWEELNDSGVEAWQQGRFAEAEEFFLAALREAGKFAPQDPRLATSLNNLATLYFLQEKFAHAEPLYQRALAIVEKALGSDHPDLAVMLDNYAALLRKTDREAEAEKMDARAKAIRAKHH